jgi:hypothetical protein
MDYMYSASSFDGVSLAWYNSGTSVFSTVKCGLFRAKIPVGITGTATVQTIAGSVLGCTLTFTNIPSEAICSLKLAKGADYT